MLQIVCYIAGMIAISVFMFAVIYMNRRNKQEALTTAFATFGVIAVLGIIKWAFF